MRASPTGRMLWMLLVFVVANGCQSTSLFPHPAGQDSQAKSGDARSQKDLVVRPGMELAWAIKSPVDQPGLVPAGKGVVGPDGSIVMGPYGACKVQGLTMAQAGSAMEKQLSAYVRQPRVLLGPKTAASAPTEVVWRKASLMPGVALAENQQLAGSDGAIRTADFPPPSGKDGPLPMPPMPAAPMPMPPGATGPALPEKTPAAPTLTLPAPTMIGEKDGALPPPLIVQVQPVPPRHLGVHGRTPLPEPPPDAPSELKPTLLPTYVIRPPDVLLIESQKGLLTQPIRGQHLVRPDGTVGVGIYGAVLVAGKTLVQARDELARVIHAKLDPKQVKLEDVTDGLSVDVLAYNSSVYYIITDGAGLGEQVYRFPVTGSETVLDAISNINGLPVVASPKRIWLARRNPGNGAPYSIFPVDWKAITQQGTTNTNWQVMPGDRIYVQADPVRRFNNNLGKFLEPVERVLGATLLSGQAVNSFRVP